MSAVGAHAGVRQRRPDIEWPDPGANRFGERSRCSNNGSPDGTSRERSEEIEELFSGEAGLFDDCSEGTSLEVDGVDGKTVTRSAGRPGCRK
jgi:hypothetical protein